MTWNWTDDEKRVLRKGVKAELSAGQIADKLPGRTRNAVIGQAYRLGLTFVLEPDAMHQKQSAACRRAAKTVRDRRAARVASIRSAP